MRRRILFLILLCLLTSRDWAWAQSSTLPSTIKPDASDLQVRDQASYTLQVNSRVVLTDVTVLDKHGNPVRNLPREDFLVLDNGKPQKLSSFEEHREQTADLGKYSHSPTQSSFSNKYLQTPPPQVNVLLFDTTTIDIVDQMYLFQQMKLFVGNLPAGEPVAVFARWGDAVLELSSYTDSHDELITAIKRAIPRLQQPGAWMASDLDTLKQMATYLNQVPGRKNLIWFTSGSSLFLQPDPTKLPDYEARREVYDMLEAERIAIYPVDARGLMVIFGLQPIMALGSQQLLMRQDAAATGGTAYVNTNGLAIATQHIISTDGNYYTLTYSPQNLKTDGRWHRVRVKLNHPGCQLSYRHGYFDDDSSHSGPRGIGTMLRAGEKIDTPDPRSEPIIFRVQLEPAPAGMEPLSGDLPLKHGEQRFVVKYLIPARDAYPAKVQDDEETDVIDSAVLAFDHDGEPVAKRSQKVTLHVDERKKRALPSAEIEFSQSVNLPSGRNYLFVAVWDTVTGRLGTVNADVDVKPQ